MVAAVEAGGTKTVCAIGRDLGVPVVIDTDFNGAEAKAIDLRTASSARAHRGPPAAHHLQRTR